MNERRTSLFGDYDFSGKEGLEFGALGRPQLRGIAKMSYVDHLPTEKLKEKYRDDPRIIKENLVHVDYVVDGSVPLSEVVPRGRYHFAVGVHVGEHVPDLLGWWHELAEILAPDGHVFLALPDKRRCFDVARPLSTTAELVGAWLERRAKPSPATIFANYAERYLFKGKGVWVGTKPLSELSRAGNLHDAMAHSRLSLTEYIDGHCWVFTPISFASVMRDLAELEILPFKLVRFSIREGLSEFCVALQKCSDKAAINRSIAAAMEVARRDEEPLPRPFWKRLLNR